MIHTANLAPMEEQMNSTVIGDRSEFHHRSNTGLGTGKDVKMAGRKPFQGTLGQTFKI
jgi:hypothetical protein